MKTNLIFKRQVNVDGVPKVITRVVHVDIPSIDSGEGWILSGHADCVEICQGVTTTNLCENTNKQPDKQEPRVSCNVTKFVTDVEGTAKLVRSKGIIKIVARTGKTTRNQSSPNSVCINDYTKSEFFKSCRQQFGNTGCFQFSLGTDVYDYWNAFIDKEYQRQKELFLTK